MSKRFLMVLTALITMGVQVFAQSAISGKVTDAKGEAIIGAGVVVKGTQTGAVTDLDGLYTLQNVKQGATLVFSCVGYASQEVVVGAQKTINVSLSEDTTYLDEIVVVAYGTQKRKDLTGSLTEVKSDVIAIQNTTTVSRALEGAAPGIQVVAVDGQPGYDMAIRLRGVSSTNGSSATTLVVIDGVPQQTTDRYENPLSQLNPDDIASVSVLKDAASTALYGSRAANGVILITTKSGQEGKAKFSFQSRVGWNALGNYNVKAIDTAEEYYEYFWQSLYNSYRYGVNGKGMPGTDANGEYFTNVKNPNCSDAEARLFASQHLFDYNGSETSFQKNVFGNNLAYNVPGLTFTPTGSGTNSSATMGGAYLIDPNTGRINPDASLLYEGNAADLVLQDSFRQEYNLSANGGTDRVHYYASFGYQSDPSYLLGSSFSRYSGRANFDAKITKWMKMGVNVGYSKTKTNGQAGRWGSRQIGAASGNAMLWIKGWQPIIPVYEMDENGNVRVGEDGNKIVNVNNKSYSPVGNNGYADRPYSSDYSYVAETNLDQQDITTWTTRAFTDINFLKHFNFHVAFNMDQQNWKRTTYMNHIQGRGTPNGQIGLKTTNRLIINTQQLLNYNQDFGKHHVDAMVGHEYEDITKDYLNFGSAYELMVGKLISTNFVSRYTGWNGGENTASPYFGKDIFRTESYLSRANYNFDQKYYLSGSFRVDGSSKFLPDMRWGKFWSVGAGWRISEEPFMQNISWLDNAKFRTSYGVTGNASGVSTNYPYAYWGYGVAKWAESTSGTGVPAEFSITSSGLQNYALTWENVHQFDLGLDFSVLKSRLTGALDFYNNETVNSYFNQTVSPLASAGVATLKGNAARLRNRGFEIELDADLVRTKDMTLSIALNGTHYRTTLIDVPDDQIPHHDNTMDVPEGCWTDQTEDMNQAGTSGVAGRGIMYLRGEGKDLFNLYMPKYAGVDKESGLPMYWHRVTYYDVNPYETTGLYEHSGRYAEYNVGDNVKTLVAADASCYEVGTATPDWIGGMQLNFRWKNFDASINTAYQLGGKFFSLEYSLYLYRSSSCESSGIPVSKTVVGNTWTPERQGAYFPMQWFPSTEASNLNLDGALLPGSNNYTDMSLFNASYFRLKNITVGYTLPKKFTQKANISALRVFASADNVLIFSAESGIDPSMSLIGGREIQPYTFPQMQTFTFGVNLDF